MFKRGIQTVKIDHGVRHTRSPMRYWISSAYGVECDEYGKMYLIDDRGIHVSADTLNLRSSEVHAAFDDAQAAFRKMLRD